MAKTADLLPDLADWNGGKGISPHDWLATFIRSDQCVAYGQLFWPKFIEHSGYIFRDGFSISRVGELERQGNRLERWQIEAEVNTLYLDDLLFSNEAWSGIVEERALHVGQLLREAYSVKLSRDFPDREFIVELWDGSQPDSDQISLSFWQKH